jgi:serine/threonine-protein kinase
MLSSAAALAPMADSPSQTGQTKDTPPAISGWMAGEYRLGRKLGEGGFGAVYEAVHPLLKRRAAVKVLHRIAGSDSEAVLRFVAEARAVNQIRNQYIIDIFSFGKLADGRHFYVMDLLEGEPLDRYLARERRSSVVSAVQLLRPIAEALDAAHVAGVVHRDLKPQNIYLTWDANGLVVPKLLDFGMAKLLGDSPVHTVSGTPLGTPLYMSPEQARGDLVDGRSDIYALGVLCFELITGRLPITGENTIAVLMAHIIQSPPRMSEVCPELPPELDEPVQRMLEKKPEARPATATDALAELARAAERTGAVIPSEAPRLTRPPPRSEPDVEAARSPNSADTVLQSIWPASATEPELSRNALARDANRGSRQRVPWPVWGLLVALGAASAFWLAHRAPRSAAGLEPSARAAQPRAVAPTTSALSSVAPPSSQVEPMPAHAEAAASASAAAPEASTVKPKKHISAGPTGAGIPRDLESPF